MALVSLVYLVDQQHHRDGHLGHLVQKVAVFLRIFHHIGHIEQHIGICQCRLREGQHHLLHLVVGLEHARRVGEDDLAVFLVYDTHNAVARGLRLEGGDTDALAHQLVHQRALAHIGVAHDVYKTCFVHAFP